MTMVLAAALWHHQIITATTNNKQLNMSHSTRHLVFVGHNKWLDARDNVFHVHDSILRPRIYLLRDKENNKYFILSWADVVPRDGAL